MISYDDWLYDKADEYYRGCEPKVVHVEEEYENKEETSTTVYYNCQECECTECEYWNDYN